MCCYYVLNDYDIHIKHWILVRIINEIMSAIGNSYYSRVNFISMSIESLFNY